MSNLLAGPSSSLEGILSAIAEYYGGVNKRLLQTSQDKWAVMHMDGKHIPTVQVVLRKKRYRFEIVPGEK